MRCKAFTTFWLILAFTCGALAFVQFTRNDLSSIFGEPALPKGVLVLPFEPASTRVIEIDSAGQARRYEELQGQWVMRSKGGSLDRADYRSLEAMLACVSNLTILESFPANDENRRQMGLTKPMANIKLRTVSEKKSLSFSIGKLAAWHLHVPGPDSQTPARDFPAIYLQPKKSEFIYLCSSPYIDDMLANGFGSQRDLRPFFFPPELLAEVTVSKPNGDLVIARNSPVGQWSIEKPFQLEARPEAVAELVEGLYKLTALEALNKPAPAAQDPDLTLSVRFFARDGSVQSEAVTLALSEPANGGEDTYIGRLNDWRKDIEFILPRKAINSAIGIDELPLTTEKLRGTSLSGLNLTQLRSLTIKGPELEGPLKVFIEKSPITQEWRARRNYLGVTNDANEETFFRVKKALTEEDALGTASDSAEDLAPYGLDFPAKSVTLELFEGTRETIHFGFKADAKGTPRYYFRRDDSRIVMEITSQAFFKIAARPYLWQSGEVWNFDVFDLSILQIERKGELPLTLQYSDLSQSWSARQGSKNVTGLLNENRANRYLELLETLKVTQWLGEDHVASQEALEDPVFKLTVFFRKPDDPNAPVTNKTFELAGANATGKNHFYFGRVSGSSSTFILDLPTVSKLAVQLVEEE